MEDAEGIELLPYIDDDCHRFSAVWARPVPTGPTAKERAVEATGHALDRLAERSERAHRLSPSSGGAETRPRLSFTITRFLICPPAVAGTAFDEWWAGAATERGDGRLRLHADAGHGRPTQLRSLPGRLHLRSSLVPIPVELELVAWGDWRTVLNLQLARRLIATMAWHRRRSYFAVGNDSVDAIYRRLVSLI